MKYWVQSLGWSKADAEAEATDTEKEQYSSLPDYQCLNCLRNVWEAEI